MEAVKHALIKSKELLEYYIDQYSEIQEDDMDSVVHFLNALNAGCECDDYNGFYCGCGERYYARDEAFKELKEQELIN